jgi:hypothetical protein
MTLGKILGVRQAKKGRSSPPAAGSRPDVSSVETSNQQPSSHKGERYRSIIDTLSAIAAIATLFALVFAYRATRDAESQLKATENQTRIARVQAAGYSQIVTHRALLMGGNTLGVIDAYDQLAITFSGNAQEVSSFPFSYFAYREPNGLRIIPVPGWWRDMEPKTGEIARWSANARALQGLMSTRFKDIRIITVLALRYTDILGQQQHRYWFIDNIFDAAFPPHPIDRVTALQCLNSLQAHNEAFKFSSLSYGSDSITDANLKPTFGYNRSALRLQPCPIHFS